MKKLKVVLVLLFATLFIGGCSCTTSMCSDQDLENIQASLKESIDTPEHREELRNKAIEKNYAEEQIEDYINQNIEKEIEEQYNNHSKACITIDDLEDPVTGATIEGKTWEDAFKKGLLEGLIVYPISCLLIAFTNLFGGNGGGQVLSIIIVTIIIKLFTLLLTFKSQIQNQKMQSIQVEITEISNKLKDPNLSQAEKNRLSMKVMDIYQKNGINPLSSMIQPFVSLPIFLSIWSAVSQTLVIRTGTFLGLSLGSAVSEQVFKFNVTAIILFLIMTGAQILSIKLPNIIRLKQANYKNKEKIKESNKQSAMMMNIMLAMILVSGFLLPSALAIYWTVGAVFSLFQSLIFQNPKVKDKISKLGNRKNKAKVIQ